jgi:hypothetical protein
VKDTNTALIRAVAVLGGFVIAGIVALTIWGPQEGGLVTGTISTIVTIVTLLVTNLLTLRASSEARVEAKVAADTAAVAADTAAVAANAATASKTASDKNAATLAHVSEQVAANTTLTTETQATVETTHKAVNSRMDELIATVQQLAETQKELAAAQAMAQGITIGRGQSGHDEKGTP